ncbi:MAG: GDSL-type esterase/lipase family protein [Planctomycetota bacterium]
MTSNSAILGLTVYLFGSGLAFFLGVGCVWSSMALFAIPARRWINRLAVVICVLGLIFIGLSAAPFPSWFYAIAGSLTFGWLIVEQTSRVGLQRWKARLRILVGLTWLAGVTWELPYQLSPTVNATGNPPLFIIADSVTAGVGEREAVTWPVLLERAHPVQVHDYSRMGAGVVSAYAQAERLPDASGGIVLLEIGGNDLLGTTSLATYEQGLDRLLTRVATHDRTVIMFEIPLPPLCNEFGRIQRRVAARHGVPLIPKRLLMQILATPGHTLDSIHLSQAGHNQLAALVWKLIQPAYLPQAKPSGPS